MQRPQRTSRKNRKIDLAVSKRFLFLGRNSGIHGLGHLFRGDAPYLARLFWLLVLLVSAGCLLILLGPVVERGAEVSYTADTRYLDWTTTFPAITVCEKYNTKIARRKMNELYPDLMQGQTFDLQTHLTESVFNRVVSCRKGLCDPCGTKIPCDFPWRKVIENMFRTCNELLTNCSHNGQEFPCCKRFHTVDSEYGPCYSFNTLQTENSNLEPSYSLNRSTGPGSVHFRLLSDATVSVHSPEELSTNFLDINLKLDVQPSLWQYNRVEYTFSLVQFSNDPMLQYDSIDRRGCRYLHEVPASPFDAYPVYSYGACRLAHTTEHSYKHCNCIHSVRDLAFKGMYCNFTGMNCLVDYETQKRTLGLDNDLLEEDPCLPSCLESELTTVHISRRWVLQDTAPGAKVIIQMANLPTVRFERNLLRNDLDLVVSVGGMVGLFFGASIFSLVEILYLFLRKVN